jgi:hypothetical protein
LVTVPPAPGLFTTARVEPISLFSTMIRCKRRAVLSLVPPGAVLTMSSTFFCGDHACAALPALAAESASATSTRISVGALWIFVLFE